MKLSTKGRYGLRALVDLVIHSKGDPVSLLSIAQRQDISENYLEQVFSTLRKAGIVKSIKGAQGGYSLMGQPENMTVWTILRALEGDLSVIDMEQESNNGEPNTLQYCIKVLVWDQINKRIHQLIDGITLEDLVSEYHKIHGNEGLMFYI